jgi:hypothetical protein
VTGPSLPALSREERRRRRRRAQLARWAIRLAAALVVFVVGIALGQALEDNPQPSTPFTQVRTLPPPGPESVPG